MPITLILSYCVYNLYNILLYQLVYFYIICYYLLIKIKSINKVIIELIKSKIPLNEGRVYRIMGSINEIRLENHDYNVNYWSTFLLCIWILFIVIISAIAFLAMFFEDFYYKYICILAANIFLSGLIIVIRSASSVNNEANMSYKLMYSLISSKRKKILLPSFRLKVYYIKQ